MKVVQVNTIDSQGGAARAAYRLHSGLRASGIDSKMLVKEKTSADDTVQLLATKVPMCEGEDSFLLSEVVQRQYIDANRTSLSNTLFSLPYPGYDISRLESVQNADIINLHWVAFYQSPVTIWRLLQLGKPVVWTLHDMWAFTGGCHYSAGCEGYCQDCTACPQLFPDPYGLPATILADKCELFMGADLTIVTPSKWLGDCARRSRLFRNNRIEVIPNSIEIDKYVAASKAEAKKSFGIAEDVTVLLCGADSCTEKRKGFQELASAFTFCAKNAVFSDMVANGKLVILSFGHATPDIKSWELPVISLGYLSDEKAISSAYSAADLFILPSLEDNLPNMMLEAMSCGTPVIAFAVGGIPDVVINDVTGRLAEPFNTKELSRHIIELAQDAVLRSALAKESIRSIEQSFNLNVQAKNYSTLYDELLSKAMPVRAKASKKLYPMTNSIETKPIEPDARLGPAFSLIKDSVFLDSLRAVLPRIYKHYRRSVDLCGQNDDELHKEIKKLHDYIDALTSSASWKITAPLRAAHARLQRMRS